jgi:hypothetical protein
MFGYYIKLAIKSVKRNPILSLLMITAIALGIGHWCQHDYDHCKLLDVG